MKWQIAECVGRLTPSTRIVKNKKGKGSYNRKKEQSYKGSSFFHIRLLLPGKHSSDVCNSFRKIARITKTKKMTPLIRRSSFLMC
ncbi:alternative ribosome rescue factor ArfA [Peribacillus frigoritolerans]|uniref:alternative ribosome rescue factor ArfA n=1 Tax=Peribacillus frigoritolerans TaxID=450367 RepID=UPI00345C6F10